jgi:L-threonylcarbamoyladenylate synthase
MELIKVNPSNPNKIEVSKAAEIIKKGGTVAFPTETVYGLGANALEPRAVKKIFDAKGRPADNPLIVHVTHREDVKVLVKKIPDIALDLMERFWPGPLTLVMEKAKGVPDITTGGLDTVAIRMPAHPVALSLISLSGAPIAAPSANASGKPSPTTAKHVIDDMFGKIDAIIDGGPADVGVESTVLDITKNPPVILRPGGITHEDLERAIGDVGVHPGARGKTEMMESPPSPGMKYRHYAPNAKLILVEGGDVVAGIQELCERYSGNGEKIGIMASMENAPRYRADLVKIVGSRGDLAGIARNLFGTLRALDDKGVDTILAEGFEPKGMGLAIMNRLRKAASEVILKGDM